MGAQPELFASVRSRSLYSLSHSNETDGYHMRSAENYTARRCWMVMRPHLDAIALRSVNCLIVSQDDCATIL